MLVHRGDLGVVDIAQVRDLEGLQLAHVRPQGAGGSVGSEARAVRLRGVVGRVRIHRVHEHEEGVVGTYPFKPLERLVDDPPHRNVDAGAREVLRQLLEVAETAAEPEGRSGNAVAGHAERPIADRAEDLGQVGNVAGQNVVSAASAVIVWIEAGQNAGGRRPGPGGLGHRVLEPNGPGREPVDVRGGRTVVAVAAESIGPERIDEEDEHVRELRFGPVGGALRFGSGWRRRGGGRGGVRPRVARAVQYAGEAESGLGLWQSRAGHRFDADPDREVVRSQTDAPAPLRDRLAHGGRRRRVAMNGDEKGGSGIGAPPGALWTVERDVVQHERTAVGQHDVEVDCRSEGQLQGAVGAHRRPRAGAGALDSDATPGDFRQCRRGRAGRGVVEKHGVGASSLHIKRHSQPVLPHAGVRRQTEVAEQFAVPGDLDLRRCAVRGSHGTTCEHQFERSRPGEMPGELRSRSLVCGEGAPGILFGRGPAGHQFASLVVVARNDLARFGRDIGKIQV